MKFYDQVTISIASGKGGDGSIAGRHEAKVPRGGPAGGDGGKGGSIIFRARKDEWTLMPYRYKRKFQAKPGEPGQSKDKYGADAKDIELPVPVGTLIKDAQTGTILAHLSTDGQTRLGAKGGKGGAGNIHFKNPQNQFPTMALYGEPGEIKELVLELQLLADVALIGTPSVGKSTLINAVSQVKAKTADYPFTTLVPNIGVVDHKGGSFTMIDVPGLIEGASDGKGLGNEFLRHILKARVFLLFVDITKDLPGMQELGLLLQEIMAYVQQRLIGSHIFAQDIKTIQQEFFVEDGILRYRVFTEQEGQSVLLLQKAIYIVVTKIDTLPDKELRDEYLQTLAQRVTLFLETQHLQGERNIREQSALISAMTKEGVNELLDHLLMLLQNKHFLTIQELEQVPVTLVTHPEISVEETTTTDLPALINQGYVVQKTTGNMPRVWSVLHDEICYLTFVLPRGNEEAELWYRDALGKKGYLTLLTKAGAKKGDILKILPTYAGHKEKYILRA